MTPLIQIEKLTKFYGRSKVPALNKIDLSIPEGSIFGLLGPNGAGKTTLISTLMGLQKKTSGTLLFEGKPLEDRQAHMRSITGFVPQDLAFYPVLTVAENLDFYTKTCDVPRHERKQRIERAVNIVKLESHYHKTAEKLSGGLKRRLNLAIGLLNNPKVLFLDEPTVGIDPQSRNFILETIMDLNRSEGMTLIYTSHYMEEVQQICDQIAIIGKGQILLQGKLTELLANMETSRLCFSLEGQCSAEIISTLQQTFSAESVGKTRFIINKQNVAELAYPLIQFLNDQGLRLAGLQFGYGSLEELYMQQTMPSLRG